MASFMLDGESYEYLKHDPGQTEETLSWEYVKRETYRGGATDPFVVAWPARIAARGEVRSQYAHAIDLVPTILDALAVEPPATVRGTTQTPLEGVSFASSFDAADAPTGHTTQYFELLGHRAIHHDGWRAVCPWPGPNYTEAAAMGRRIGEPITPEALEQLDASGWELYDINEDPTESSNVAAEHPDRLRELIALWWDEAEKYKVLPLDGSLQERLMTERPQTSRPRTRFIFRPHTSLVPSFMAPTTPLLFELEGLSCGYDFGSPATKSYQPPFTFTGTIHSVTIEVSGELIRDTEADIARLMAHE